MLRTVLAFTSALAITATVGAQSFATHSTFINAGVVILDSDTNSTQATPASAAPFAFYNLDNATTVKPAGWVFQNPLAPHDVTQVILTRWGGVETESPNQPYPLPALGDKITKRNAAYWEVFLDNLSDQDISQYNILLVNPHAYASLNPIERERLRRFVDGGGILWIDPGALPNGNPVNAIDQTNNFPIGFSITSALSSALDADYTQPILQTPFPLTSTDIGLLDGGFSTTLLVPNPGIEGGGAGSLASYFGSTLGDFFTLQPYSVNGTNNFTGMYTRIGDGFVVVTARGASLKLNRPQAVSGYFTNNQYFALDGGGKPIVGPDGIAAAKLAINMISLTGESKQAQSGSRKANSIAMDLDAPLLARFNTESLALGGTFAPGQSPISQPTFYKGLMFVTENGWLYAFDAVPSTDLDGDGQSDDGIPDYSLGAPYDMVWKAQIGGTLSTPVCAEIADFIGTVPRDQVWVTDANGTLYGFNALPTVGGFYSNNPNLTNLPPFVKLLPPVGGASNLSPSALPVAPTIHDGIVYVADTQDFNGTYNFRIWMVDAHIGAVLVTHTPTIAGNWIIGGQAAGAAAPGDVSGSPVVGYIPIDDNSGGSDKVIYIPVRPNSVGGSCGVLSIWIGARGEAPPQPPVVFPDHLQITTRAGLQGLPIFTDPTLRPEQSGGILYNVTDPRSIRLVVDFPNGTPMSAAQMSTYFAPTPSDNGSGTLSFPFQVGQSLNFQNLLTAGYSVRVDYTIDWGQNNVTQGDLTGKIVRDGIAFPDVDGQPAKRQIIGNLAMSPTGYLYAVVSDPSALTDGEIGGSFYCLKEYGRNSFQIYQRYDLYPKHTVTLNQAQPVSYDEVLFDKDPVNQFVETAGGVPLDWVTQPDRRMFNFVFTSGPTVRNGEVFVAAQAQKNLNVGGLRIPNMPVTILMAFAANPPAPEIPIGSWPTGSSLSQPDFDQSDPASLSTPSATELIQDNPGQSPWTYDPDTGFLVFQYLASTSNPVTAGSRSGTSANLHAISTCFSLSQPLIVHRPGSADTLLDPSTTGRWSPLLWYQVFEGAQPTFGSSPVITGDTVFLGMSSVLPSLYNTPSLAPGPSGVISGTTAEIPSNDQFLQSIDYLDGINGSYRSWQSQLWTLPSPAQLNPLTGGNPNLSNPYLLWPQTTGVNTFSQYITRLNETTLGASTMALGLSAGNGTLAAVGEHGIYAFDRADFLVCDEGRLARFDPAGNAIQVNQGFFNSGPGGTSNASTYKPLIRPTKAYDLDGNTSLVVDQGANRIIKVDRAGNELRSIDSFQFDPNYGNPQNQAIYSNIWPQEGGFLSESTSLNSPSDVYTYSEYVTPPVGQPQEVTNQLPLEYWTHYVIADQGNNRIVELVDRFQADPVTREVGPPVEIAENVLKDDGTIASGEVAQVGVILWHSPAAQSGRGFSYNSINRVWIPPQAQNGLTPAVAGRYVYVAGVGNASTVQDQNGVNAAPNTAPGSNALGGIVIFDPLAPVFAQVYNFMTLPNVSTTPFWDFTNTTWDTATPLNRTNLTAANLPAPIPFSNVNSVTAKVYATYAQNIITSSQIQIMVAGSDGVFEVSYNPNLANLTQSYAGGLPVDWYMPSQVYRSLRNTGVTIPFLQQPDANPNELNATYAKRLDNGDVLIVNGYVGTYYPNNSDRFGGEIIEVQGNSEPLGNTGLGFNFNNPNLGFGLPSIRFELGPIQGTRGLMLPTFADRR